MPLIPPTGFDDKPEHASWLGVSPRTIDRYKAQKNGLPYTTLGGKDLYKREWTVEWLELQRRQRNPGRSGRAA